MPTCRYCLGSNGHARTCRRPRPVEVERPSCRTCGRKTGHTRVCPRRRHLPIQRRRMAVARKVQRSMKVPFARTQCGLVLAAVAAHLGTPEPFAVADLIAAVWGSGNPHFALEGYPALVDGHKVRCCLFGQRGLVARGYLERVGASRFRLTECGRAKARGVDVPAAATEPKPPKLLEAARQSAAYRLLDGGRADSVSWSDALAFWGTSERRDNVRECMAAMGKLLADRETPELRVLGACHDYLRGRFGRMIELANNESGRATA